jgi:hypothetical protein
MRDEDILLNLFEISQWLDRLIKEIQGINLVMTDLIATVPVSVEAWDTVGDEIWTQKKRKTQATLAQKGRIGDAARATIPVIIQRRIADISVCAQRQTWSKNVDKGSCDD